MIRRVSPDGLLLITQQDHAELAGDIAAHWGNGDTPEPRPRDEMIEAIRCHDAGWLLHDGAPTLNGERLPATFYEMPLEWYVRVWVASVAAAVARVGPMAGLVVSWHFGALARHAPIDPENEAVVNLLTNFQRSQKTRQREYCRALGLSDSLADDPPRPVTDRDEDALHNWRVLRSCDWISLLLCAGSLPEAFLQVPQDLRPATNGELDTRRLDDRRLTLTPWPLNQDRLVVEVTARCVPNAPYEREKDLVRVFAQASTTRLELELVRT